MSLETGCSAFPSKSQMLKRALPLLAVAVALADFPALAQFGSPYPTGGGGGGGVGFPGGGYPGGGGGYPGGGVGGGGIPFPGRRGSNTAGTAETVTGNIQRISTNQLVLDPGDRRNIIVTLEKNTKYFTKSGGTSKFGDFDSGDEVSVDAVRDKQSMLHAQAVTLVSKGAAGNISVNDGDSDRPRLKRTPTPGDAPQTPAKPDTPMTDDPDRPRLTRKPVQATTPVEGDPDTPPARAKVDDVPLKPVPRDADDPGPPVIRRGIPQQTASASRPSIKSEEVNGVTKVAAPPVIEAPSSRSSETSVSEARAAMKGPPTGDPIINAAREAAWQYSDTLPNYIVKQYTTRYQTDAAKGNRTSWQALDVVTSDVVSEGGKESYRNIQVNGKPVKDIEKTGSWSTGEFSTILLNLLAPQTDADFHGKRSSTIVNRPAWRYDYTVEQPNSNWSIHAASQQYKPAYSGSIWVDKQTNRVLRIEMSAKTMPQAFPLDTVESAVDYDFVNIGDQKFLLPTHSEALSCTRGSGDCTRNTIDFRNYRKFGADTSITFEADK
ncbi:MAG: hypothetical protein JWN34_2607 [Bryobacterales bacterium]|nr:hypothetical protein [Bryobacterales bacterium]